MMSDDRIYSFDIFDTLVTRRTATPQGIFSLIAYQLKINSEYSDIPNHIKLNFESIRLQTALFLKMISKNYKDSFTETFDLIYDYIAFNNCLTESQKNKLKELEIKTEIENLVLIPENLNLLKEHLSKSEKVVLISDMYYNEKEIHRILDNIDSCFTNIKIYSSADCKCTKADNGALFKYVSVKENTAVGNIIHFGDNEKSDVQNAKKAGAKATRCRTANLLDFEEYILKEVPNNKDIQLVIGNAKLTRLLDCNNIKMQYGASFSTPLLYPYVRWVIDLSIKLGFNRLYFIARDGYILQKIADIVIKNEKLDIKTKYIYGSREVWRIPSITENSDLAFIFREKCRFKNLDNVLDIFNISREELAKFIDIEKLNKKFKPSDLEFLENSLVENKEFKKFLYVKNKDNRELVKEYLKQEIDFTDEHFAFVDLSGSGATQTCLCSIISDFYDKKINSFYIRGNSWSIIETTHNKRIYYPNAWFISAVIEACCRAPHGGLLRYERRGNKIVPVFDDEDILMKQYDYESFVNGVILFTKRIIGTKIQHNIGLIFFEKYQMYIFKYKLSKTTAEIIGSIPMRTSKISSLLEFAPKLEGKGIQLLKKANDCRGTYNCSFYRSSDSVQKFLSKIKSYNNNNKFFSISVDISPPPHHQIAHINFLGLKIGLKKFIGMK